MSGGATVLLCHGLDDRFLSKIITSGSHFAAEASKWTVGYRHDLVVEEELDKVRLGTCRVEIDLVTEGLVLSVSHDIGKDLCVEVRDGEALAETFIDETFESGPQDVHRHLGFREEVVGPMEVVEVDIVRLQSLQALSESRLGILVLVVPDLRGQEHIAALDGS